MTLTAEIFASARTYECLGTPIANILAVVQMPGALMPVNLLLVGHDAIFAEQLIIGDVVTVTVSSMKPTARISYGLIASRLDACVFDMAISATPPFRRLRTFDDLAFENISRDDVIQAIDHDQTFYGRMVSYT